MCTNGNNADELSRDSTLWTRLVDLRCGSIEAEASFLQEARDPLGYVRRALSGPPSRGVEAIVALGLLHQMDVEDRMAVFSELLVLCLSQKFGNMARSVVLTLPKDWLLANIEAASRCLIEKADDLEFFALLRLFKDIDLGLAIRLAREGARSADEDVMAVGSDFLIANT